VRASQEHKWCLHTLKRSNPRMGNLQSSTSGGGSAESAGGGGGSL
jgi:hypothetical protein